MADFHGRRDNLVRAVHPGVEWREADREQDDGAIGVLSGHFSVFDSWYEVRSSWEGNFLEKVAPGAFRKTFQENREKIRVLYDHGHDPSVGNKPLGPLRELREDDTGGFYEVPLLDTSYNRDLLPALKAGLLGASFRFQVVRDDKVDDPGESEHNPRGIPERTIKEARVFELGPVTFPASHAASAGVRSMTDEYMIRSFLEDPETLRDLLLSFLPAAAEEQAGEDEAPTDESAEPEAHPVVVRRSNVPLFGLDKEEKPAWLL